MNNYSYFHKYANSMWKNVNLSSYDSIKGLLKFRYRFDKIRISDSPMHLKNAYYYQSYLDEDIVCIYVWIDSMIEKCKFTLNQKNVLEMYMAGWDEEDIALCVDKTRQNIQSTINSICRRIYAENYKEWYYQFVCIDKIKAPYEYKKCGVCFELLPLTHDFFGIDNQNQDGFRNVCKMCRKDKIDTILV